jgi:hypothetical protein
MFQPGFIHDVGLDPKLVARDMEACVGLADRNGLISEIPLEFDGETGNTTDQVLDAPAEMLGRGTAASCYRRAGAHALLLGEVSYSAELFGKAADQYFELGLPYQRVMTAMTPAHRGFSGQATEMYQPQDWLRQYEKGLGSLEARPRRRQREPTEKDLWKKTPPAFYPEALLRQFQYPLLEAWANPQHHKFSGTWSGIVEELGMVRSKPVGTLGLPLGCYLGLSRAVRGIEDRDAPSPRVEQALLPFIVAFANAFVSARDNKHQWQRMALSFHPLEPDILGILRMVKPGIGWLGKWIQHLPVDSLAKTILVEACAMDDEG